MNQHYPKFSKSVKFLGAICGGLLIGVSAIPQLAVAQRQANSKVNPCPSIFYEQPHDNRVLVPEGCPPNAFTRQAQQGGVVPGSTSADPTPGQIRQGVGGDTPSNGSYSSQRQTTRTYSSQGSNGDYTVRTYSSSSSSQNLPNSARQPLTSPNTPVRVIPAPEQRQSPIAMVMPTSGQVAVKLKNNTNARITYEAIGHTQRRVLSGGEEVVLQNLPVPVTITTVRQDNGFVKVIPTSTSNSGTLELSLDEEKNVDNNQGVIRIQQDGQVFLN